MAKKRFKDTGVGKFLLEKIPNVVGAIAGDTPVGSVIQAIIGGSDMSEADKKIALKKLDIERDIAYSNYRKIVDKCEKVENKIYKLNKKYTYSKKIKVKNPYYKEKELIAI